MSELQLTTRYGTVSFQRYMPNPNPTIITRPITPVLIFLPGWCGTKEQWREVCLYLVLHGKECFALDYVDRGRSNEGSSIAILAGAVAEFVRERWPKQVAESEGGIYLAGHSMGGRVAVEAAAELGPITRGIIGVEALWDVLLDTDPKVIEQTVQQFRDDYESAASEYVAGMFQRPLGDNRISRLEREVRESVLDPNYRSQSISLVQDMLGNNGRMRDLLPQLAARKLLINSDTWRRTNVEGVQKYGFELAPTISGAGHYVMLERSEEVATAINRFVDSTEDASLKPPRSNRRGGYGFALSSIKQSFVAALGAIATVISSTITPQVMRLRNVRERAPKGDRHRSRAAP